MKRLSDNDLAELVADCLATGCPEYLHGKLTRTLGELMARQKPYKFTVGAPVRLKGTGPHGLVMNVDEQHPDGYVCIWATDRGKHSEFFREEALESAASDVDPEL